MPITLDIQLCKCKIYVCIVNKSDPRLNKTKPKALFKKNIKINILRVQYCLKLQVPASNAVKYIIGINILQYTCKSSQSFSIS